MASVEISDRRNGNLISATGNIADDCLSDIRTYTYIVCAAYVRTYMHVNPLHAREMYTGPHGIQ